MRKQLLFILGGIVLLLMTNKASAQYDIPKKMEWWYEARFGMFIHFGSYSYLAHGEWAFASEKWTKENYQSQVTTKFNPTNFNAIEIAELAKNAGMKYLVITAKHHEGFCLWPTEVESFKDVVGETPFSLQEYTQFGKRDIIQELENACDSVGIKFCLYYSILDWEHSSQTINGSSFTTMASMAARDAYINDMTTQLKELIENYHPYIMWFDGDWTGNYGDPTLTSWWTYNDGINLYDTLTTLDPSLIVNERVFRGAEIGDYESPEQTVPTSALNRPWETNQTMNNSWGYNISDNSYKTSSTLVQQLVDVVSKDGNYLLNIGPKGDGSVPDQSINLLSEIGKWMDVYGQSIYGATCSPFTETPTWGRFTKKDGTLYAHVFNWPTNGLLKIPVLTNEVNKITIMNDSLNTLSYTDSIGYYWINIPNVAPNALNSVVCFDVVGIPKASSEYTKVTNIVISGEGGSSSIAKIGGTLQLKAIVIPVDATDKSLIWSVSDTSIATIDSNGLILANNNGKITVTATANDGSDALGQAQIIVGKVAQGDDLLQNCNFETQGAWLITQCDANGIINAIFEGDGEGPLYGSNNFLQLKSAGNATAQVFVYQKIVVKKGHTYEFSLAMKDASTILADDWISVVYSTKKPVENQDVQETTIASFGSWMDCNGVNFDGLVENSCAASSAYFTIPHDIESDTIYFGIDIGTWGTACNFNLYFDNFSLKDTAVVTTNVLDFSINNSLLLVYPNPSDKGHLTVQYNNNTTDSVKYTLMNTTGVVKQTGNIIDKTTLDVSSLSPGIYFVKVIDQNKTAIQKVLIR